MYSMPTVCSCVAASVMDHTSADVRPKQLAQREKAGAKLTKQGTSKTTETQGTGIMQENSLIFDKHRYGPQMLFCKGRDLERSRS